MCNASVRSKYEIEKSFTTLIYGSVIQLIRILNDKYIREWQQRFDTCLIHMKLSTGQITSYS